MDIQKRRQSSATKQAVARWRTEISGWEESGLSQAEYCDRRGINRSVFNNWKRRFEAGEFPGTGLVEIPAARMASPVIEFTLGEDGRASLRISVELMTQVTGSSS